MTPNDWQRKAQERYPHGALRTIEGWAGDHAIFGEPDLLAAASKGGTFLPLPAILDHLAYERQECERCAGGGTVGDVSLGTTISDKRFSCPACNGTGLAPDYRKAQEWAVKLGVE